MDSSADGRRQRELLFELAAALSDQQDADLGVTLEDFLKNGLEQRRDQWRVAAEMADQTFSVCRDSASDGGDSSGIPNEGDRARNRKPGHRATPRVRPHR